jgi:hypothetical protein
MMRIKRMRKRKMKRKKINTIIETARNSFFFFFDAYSEDYLNIKTPFFPFDSEKDGQVNFGLHYTITIFDAMLLCTIFRNPFSKIDFEIFQGDKCGV